MKTLLALFVVTGLITSFALAEDAPAKPPKQNYVGVLTAVDEATQKLTVKKAEGDEKAFKCSKNCTFATKEKATAEITDLKVGTKVSVWYRDIKSENNCYKVQSADGVAKTPAKK